MSWNPRRVPRIRSGIPGTFASARRGSETFRVRRYGSRVSARTKLAPHWYPVIRKFQRLK